MKVGDFGLAEDIYARGYVREDSKTVKVLTNGCLQRALKMDSFHNTVMWYVIQG